MSANEWAQRLIDDTTDVLDVVLPARFAPAAKALVATTLTTVPLGAQLIGELADRGPREKSGTVDRDEGDEADATHTAGSRSAKVKGT